MVLPLWCPQRLPLLGFKIEHIAWMNQRTSPHFDCVGGQGRGPNSLLSADCVWLTFLQAHNQLPILPPDETPIRLRAGTTSTAPRYKDRASEGLDVPPLAYCFAVRRWPARVTAAAYLRCLADDAGGVMQV
eukprot:7087716-Pyramimonas_sp.AAC.1